MITKVLAIVSAGLAAVPAAAQSAIYEMDIPGDGEVQRGTTVSASGQVAWGFADPEYYGQVHALRWTRTAGTQDCGAPMSSNGAYAWAVSGDGRCVVGWIEDSTGWHPFRSTAPGTFELMTAPAVSCQAKAVSGDGSVIVGRANIGGYHAVRWVNGVYQDLGVPPGFGSAEASGVSSDGSTVVGTADGRPFRWSASTGSFEILSTGGWANDASASGDVVVGTRYYPAIRAIRWSNGMAQDLGYLPGIDPQSYAMACTGDGSTVVGFAFRNYQSRAFLWNASSGMRDLADVLTSEGINMNGWILGQAQDISTDGSVIVGTGVHNSHSVAFVAVRTRRPSVTSAPTRP